MNSKITVVVSLVVVGFLASLLLRQTFAKSNKCDREAVMEFAKVRVGEVELNIPIHIAKYIKISSRRGKSGEPLLKRIDKKIKCPESEFIAANNLELSFYGMTSLSREKPNFLPKGLEYLMIYSSPDFQSYTNYPQADREAIGVSHYYCIEGDVSCKIFMTHSKFPIFFEIGVKASPTILGRPNPENSWYERSDWPELVKEIDRVITSMSVEVKGN